MLYVRVVLTRNMNFIIDGYVDVKDMNELYSLLQNKEKEFFRLYEVKKLKNFVIINKKAVAFIEEK